MSYIIYRYINRVHNRSQFESFWFVFRVERWPRNFPRRLGDAVDESWLSNWDNSIWTPHRMQRSRSRHSGAFGASLFDIYILLYQYDIAAKTLHV